MEKNSKNTQIKNNSAILKDKYFTLLEKDTFKKSQFIDFIESGLASYGHHKDFQQYSEQLATKHNIKDWDLLLNIEPQYLHELGIKRIHQKLFMEAIKKRQLHTLQKKKNILERPKESLQVTERWRMAEKTANDVIKALPNITADLNTNLVKCQQQIDILLLALFSNQHVLLLGPPGTAKTTIAMRVSSLIADGSFFYNLMTRFTTPDQIFGPISLPSLKLGQLSRNTDLYLPTATMALLDQIFKSSSIILNSVLDILNERTFKNNGKINSTPILTVIGTSNDEAIANDLLALFDRFAFRYWTHRLTQDDLLRYLNVLNKLPNDRFRSKYSFTWDVVVSIKQSSRKIIIPDYVLRFIVQLVKSLQYDISQRRIKKAIQILKVNSKLSQKTTASCLDCLLFKNIFPSNQEQIQQFQSRFQTLYASHVSKQFKEAEIQSQYLGEVHSPCWRKAQDKLRKKIVETLRIKSKQ